MIFFFFFNDTATTEIYTLSLHDALPILAEAGLAATPRPAVRPRRTDAARSRTEGRRAGRDRWCEVAKATELLLPRRDRKSTRLNSSHANISYAVFCLKKKKKIEIKCTDQ